MMLHQRFTSPWKVCVALGRALGALVMTVAVMAATLGWLLLMLWFSLTRS